MTVYSFNVPALVAYRSAEIAFYQLQVIVRNGMIIPTAHMADAHKMEADGYVDMFQILLSDGTSRLFLKMNNSVTWQGDDYQGTGIQLTGVAQYADDEVARPTLMLYNPNKVYTSLVDEGLLEGATLVRMRVLKEHIDNDMPIYRRQQWKISRVASLVGETIVCEVRDMVDGQNFLTPGRMFIPPEFPAVNLS